MKKMMVILMGLFLFLLAACGNEEIEKPITLKNQNGEDVSIPTGKPVAFFFMTTYT